MGLKLNLASGTDIRDGWVNLDIVPRWPGTSRGCDIIWDARKDPIPFATESVDEICAGYLLLHLAPRFHKPVLAEMHRVLSWGGKVTFAEVDMDIVMRRFLSNPTDVRLSELIWGEQGATTDVEFDEFDKHCQGFTEASLRSLISECGYKDLQRIKIHSEEVFYELTLICKKLA